MFATDFLSDLSFSGEEGHMRLKLQSESSTVRGPYKSSGPTAAAFLVLQLVFASLLLDTAENGKGCKPERHRQALCVLVLETSPSCLHG